MIAIEAPAHDKLTAVETMAVNLMNEHGLKDWTFKWDNAKNRSGLCTRTKKTISLSKPLMSIWDPGQARDTILHEIAHALTKGGHTREWRATCRRIGADPSRCWDSTTNATVPGRFKGTCANGHTIYRHRRTRISCAQCSPKFDKRHLFTWKDTKEN